MQKSGLDLMSVSVAFLTHPLPMDASFKTKFTVGVIHYLVGRFDHVEIIFENVKRPDDFYACSVVDEGRVFFMEKGFTRQGYEYLTITGLKPEQVNKMKNFCYHEACNKSEFNERGFYRAGSPFPEMMCADQYNRFEVKRWFCSQLVTAALQQGVLLKGYIPGSMTPTAIYDALQKTIPAQNLHKGQNPFFDYNIHCRLQNESQRLLAGEIKRISSSFETQEEKKRNRPSIIQQLLAHNK